LKLWSTFSVACRPTTTRDLNLLQSGRNQYAPHIKRERRHVQRNKKISSPQLEVKCSGKTFSPNHQKLTLFTSIRRSLFLRWKLTHLCRFCRRKWLKKGIFYQKTDEKVGVLIHNRVHPRMHFDYSSKCQKPF